MVRVSVVAIFSTLGFVGAGRYGLEVPTVILLLAVTVVCSLVYLCGAEVLVPGLRKWCGIDEDPPVDPRESEPAE